MKAPPLPEDEMGEIVCDVVRAFPSRRWPELAKALRHTIAEWKEGEPDPVIALVVEPPDPS